MQVRLHKFLIFPISRVVIGDQPGNTLMDVGRHVHVMKGIDERRPWNFSKKFRRKVWNEGCEILKRLKRIEFLRKGGRSRINPVDNSVAPTRSHNRFNIRKSLCLTNCLHVNFPNHAIMHLRSKSCLTLVTFSAYRQILFWLLSSVDQFLYKPLNSVYSKSARPE